MTFRNQKSWGDFQTARDKPKEEGLLTKVMVFIFFLFGGGAAGGFLGYYVGLRFIMRGHVITSSIEERSNALPSYILIGAIIGIIAGALFVIKTYRTMND